MQITDKVFASYLDCEYKGYLKHIGKSDVRTELESLNDETLNTIKENYFESISSKFENEHIQRDLLITTEVLRKGFHYLLNNSIQNNEIANTLDVLVRKTGESFLGNYFYDPMLILPNSKITKREKLLLTFKSILISNLQKKLLSTGKIIYGNPVKALTVRFSGLYDEANTIISKIHQFSNNEKSPNFFLNKHCNLCEFRTYCYNKAKEADCLSLFTGMKQKEITKLNNKGFFLLGKRRIRNQGKDKTISR